MQICISGFLMIAVVFYTDRLTLRVNKERMIHGCVEIPDLFRVLNLISGLTREINLLFSSTNARICAHAYLSPKQWRFEYFKARN